MSQEEHSKGQNELLFHFSSVKVIGAEGLVAVPMGQGVVRQLGSSGEWQPLNAGLPESVHVNRLHVQDGRLTACTNKGLFHYAEDHWQASQLAIGCYQYRQVGKLAMAATPYGLWSGIRDRWSKSAYSHAIVYDFLYLPQFIVLALETGLAIYDRLTDAWMDYTLGVAVTSLAVFDGAIVGVTERGELLQGNKRGGFEKYKFEQTFLFSVVTRGEEVFVCSEQGLYRMSSFHGKIMLLPVRMGGPVTDVDTDGEQFYLATLFEGVQRLPT